MAKDSSNIPEVAATIENFRDDDTLKSREARFDQALGPPDPPAISTGTPHVVRDVIGVLVSKRRTGLGWIRRHISRNIGHFDLSSAYLLLLPP